MHVGGTRNMNSLIWLMINRQKISQINFCTNATIVVPRQSEISASAECNENSISAWYFLPLEVMFNYFLCIYRHVMEGASNNGWIRWAWMYSLITEKRLQHYPLPTNDSMETHIVTAFSGTKKKPNSITKHFDTKLCWTTNQGYSISKQCWQMLMAIVMNMTMTMDCHVETCWWLFTVCMCGRFFLRLVPALYKSSKRNHRNFYGHSPFDGTWSRKAICDQYCIHAWVIDDFKTFNLSILCN